MLIIIPHDHMLSITPGNESYRFASTAHMPQKLPPKIFIIYIQKISLFAQIKHFITQIQIPKFHSQQ